MRPYRLFGSSENGAYCVLTPVTTTGATAERSDVSGDDSRSAPQRQKQEAISVSTGCADCAISLRSSQPPRHLAVLATQDEAIEWTEPGGGRAPAGSFRGPQAIAQGVFATVPANFREFRVDPEQFIDAGEHVVVVGRFRGTANSGATLDAPFAHVQRMRNGKATHFQNYVDAAAWAKAWA